MKNCMLICSLVWALSANSQTADHKPIPGTKCSMVPPMGFVASTNFAGFQNDELGASIMITEIPGPANAMANGFTADALKTRGMIFIERQNIEINGKQAALFKVSQRANGIDYLKQILVFGDDQKTFLVNGIYPEANKFIEPAIKVALLTTSYNANQDERPLDAVKFTVDETGTDFKLAKFMTANLLYSTDGKVPTEKPTMIIGNSISRGTIADKKEFCQQRLKQLPRGEQNKVKEINAVTINELKGYEILANGKNKDGKDQLVYQTILFEETGDYYMIIGMTTDEMPKYLAQFRKMAQSFKRK